MTEEHEITALKKREELRRVEQIRREMFQELLDEQKAKSNHEFAIAVRMGKTVSFVTSVSLEWIANRVKFAIDLPIWERHKADDGRIQIKADTLDELRQREPDWRRQLPMTRYLALREYHKFPPILVVAWKKWVNMSESDRWVDGRAMENSITEAALDTKGTFIDLDCEETNFYALDGQHRLMAILGLQNLLQSRRLEAKKQNGHVSSGKGITIEEMAEELGKNYPVTTNDHPEARLQSLMHERMGIEIIPAVLKDETPKTALRRLRSIFVHVNKTAKALTKGELALLDEDNGFAIVARQVMVTHKLLAHDRVRTVKGQLGDSAFHYTTLETLVEIARMYLGGVDPLYKKWNIREKGDFPFRPDESELEKGKGKLMGYFDLLSLLPSHENLIQHQEKSSADYRSETEEENILFRPIAQIALADAMAIMEKDRGLRPDDVIKRLAKGEKEGKLKLRDEKSIWFGVLCNVDDKKTRRHESYRKLCTNLLLHVLGGGTHEDIREDLKKQFRSARKVFSEESTEMKCVGLDGKRINADDLKLPQPWQ